MKYQIRKSNMVCFDNTDLKLLFETRGKSRLLKETIKKGYTADELLADEGKMHEIIDAVKLIEDKEDVELFMTLYILLEFYPGSKICFSLKDGVNIQKESIDSIENLKKLLKENDLNDFGLMTKDGLRNFQFKQYKKTTYTDELFSFIKEKLLHYGNDIGNTNLLIILQSGGNIQGSLFQNLHDNLKNLNVKGGGHILILYNEGNKFNVMNTVYPILATTRIPFRLPSNQNN